MAARRDSSRTVHRAEHMRFECHVVYTNTPVAGAFRGYGCPQGFFAQETLVDEIANELGIDPVEFHRQNVIRATSTGSRRSSGKGRRGCRGSSAVAACRNAWIAPPPPLVG